MNTNSRNMIATSLFTLLSLMSTGALADTNNNSKVDAQYTFTYNFKKQVNLIEKQTQETLQNIKFTNVIDINNQLMTNLNAIKTDVSQLNLLAKQMSGDSKESIRESE
jgi:hypothetical protein